MLSKRNIIMLSAVLAVALIVAGCGSDKKKGDSGKEGKITGRVIVPDKAPDPELGVKLPEKGKALARLYELDKLGEKLRPIEGVGPQELDSNHAFTFDKIDEDAVNLIVRIELEDSKPLAKAIVPAVFDASDNPPEVLVSMESNLEADVFMKVVATGFQQSADTEPEYVDTVFLKNIIAAEALKTEAPRETLIADLAGAAKTALNEFAATLTGEAALPSAPSVKTFRNTLRRAEARLAAELEISRYDARPIPDQRLSELFGAIDSAEKDAVKGIMLPPREMPESALVAAARGVPAARFVQCLRVGDAAEGCPKLTLEPAARDVVSLAAEIHSSSLSATYIAWKHWMAFAGDDTGAATATANTPLSVFVKYLNVPAKTEMKIRDSLKQSWREIASANIGSPLRENAIDRLNMRLRNAADYLVATYIAETPLTVRELERSLSASRVTLMRTSAERKLTPEAVESEWKTNLTILDSAFKELSGAVDKRFSGLSPVDRKGLFWTVRDIVLSASFFGVDVDRYASIDSDGDGHPDLKEIAMETDPKKDDSLPSPPLAATPASMLPPQPADADADGIADTAEARAGFNPAAADSTPALDDLFFCSEPDASSCLKAGDKADNDKDGMVDEEKPDGIDNDGDMLVDEDPTLPAPEPAQPDELLAPPLPEAGAGALRPESEALPATEPAAPPATAPAPPPATAPPAETPGSPAPATGQ